jgi:serine protease Do
VLSADTLFEKVSPTVVGVKLYFNAKASQSNIQDPFGGIFGQIEPQQTQPKSGIVGTGVIFTTDGYILTNHHVISDNPDKITVMVDDYSKPGDPDAAKEYEAKVVGSDEASDLAVLKITRNEAFQAAAFGNSANLKVGQTVCAIGYPMGVGKSITQGIVSGLNRISGNGGYELHSIQTDAAVNMGNSGGPLFDMYGNVMGIVNKKVVYENLVENIGFAITIDEAKPIINDLLTDGTVTSRPVLGITTLPLNEYSANAMGYDVKSGLLVTAINPKAPARTDGLAVGDIISKIGKKDVKTVTDIQDITKSMKPGEKVAITVTRFNQDGKKTTAEINVTLTTQKALA